MTLPVEFIAEGVPRAPKSNSCPEWQNTVMKAARQQWCGLPVPASTQVLVFITCYSYGSAPLDADNMAKPILDALKNVIYEDDRPVRDLISRHRNRNSDTYIRNPSLLLLNRLAQGDGKDTFVYIWADHASTWEVTLEPR